MMLLAPAIADRKGEHAELIEELQASGFVRARIDGEVVDSIRRRSSTSAASTRVEAIVDRFKVRPDLAQRLAESFETALRLGQGVARVAFMERHGPRRARVLRTSSPARMCNYSLARARAAPVLVQQPERRLPAAATDSATQDFFDPEKIVAQSASVARRRRGARLGPAQRLLFPAHPVAGAPLPSSTSRRPSRSLPRRRSDSWCCSAAARSRSSSSTWTARAARQAQARLRGHRQEPRAPLQGDRVGDGARGAGQVPRPRAPAPTAAVRA